MSLKRIVDALKRYNSFLVSSHINLEADAVGSELALARLLKAKSKEVIVVNQDKTPDTYDFLPGVKSIKHPEDLRKRRLNFEVAVIVDCSDMARIGRAVKFIPDDKLTLNIDHHISNENFATINWVEPKASCVAEMIYQIYESFKHPLDKDAALLLYSGILVDTGSFRYSNTTSSTHRIVAKLLEFGLPVNRIYQNIYESNLFSDIKTLGKVIQNIKIDNTGKLAWVKLEQSFLKQKMRIDLSDSILSVMRSIKDVEVALVFRSILGKGEIRVNFRSQGKVDVSRVASVFGGGGHKTASGCIINGSIDKAERLVLSQVKKMLR